MSAKRRERSPQSPSRRSTAPAELLEIFRFFPGVSLGSAVRPTRDGGIALAMAFDGSAHGKAARLVVEHIIDRVGARHDGERRWRLDAN